MPVNYDDIARRYDRHRPSGGGLCLDRLAGMLDGHRRVLEIGAGTGNTTRITGPRNTGLLAAMEPSAGMVGKAREKDVPGTWLRGRAPGTPFRDASFDAAYSTYVLQHVPDLGALFADIARVLRPGGLTAHVTVPPDYIANHPLNHYFPSFARIDLRRFTPVEKLKDLLEKAGFTGVDWEIEQEPPKPMDRAYLERVEHRFLSTFDLMPPEEYEEGLNRMRRDVEAGGGATGHMVVREAVLIWACKAERCNA